MKKILLALALLLATVRAEERHALLIGNGAYAHEPLKNPTHDARDLAKLLESLGFRVTLLENADLKTMKTAVKRFAQQLNNDSVGLFFFSGHGIQHEGRNYLLPVGTPIESSAELEYEALAGDFVADAMHESGSPTNLIFFDACRNNPLPFAANRGGQRGLAMMARGSGTLIAFATGPGHWAADGDGRNSPYTAALLRHLREPVVLEEMLRNVAKDVVQATGGQQQPWHHLSLLEAFYFNRSGSASVRREAPANIKKESNTTISSSAPSRVEVAIEKTDKPAYSEAELEEMYKKAMDLSSIEKKKQQAMKLLRKAAEAGHAKSMATLGKHYLFDKNQEAKYWFEKAAEAGYAYAYIEIGDLYAHQGGIGGNDGLEAERWYQKAIATVVKKEDREFAYFRLGRLYQEGASNLAPDLSKACTAFKKVYELAPDTSSESFVKETCKP